MSLAERFFYLQGRVLSEDGRVGKFSAPDFKLKTQNKTGPFQTRPTNRQTGFVEYGDMQATIWSDQDLQDLISLIHEQGTEEFLAVWGLDTDAVGEYAEAVNLLRMDAHLTSEPAALSEFAVTMTPDENGVETVRSLVALAAKSGDGDTQLTPVDNGWAAAAVNISSSSVADPTVITTATEHGLQAGDLVIIASHSGSTPSINGAHAVVAAPTPTTFTIAVNVTVGGTGGTVRRTSTRNGGSVHLHVDALDLDGGDGVQVDLIDSPDGVTFATCDSFDEITTEVDASDPADGYAVRLDIPASTAIDRYAALAWAFTGSPGGGETITPWAGIHRNE